MFRATARGRLFAALLGVDPLGRLRQTLEQFGAFHLLALRDRAAVGEHPAEGNIPLRHGLRDQASSANPGRRDRLPGSVRHHPPALRDDSWCSPSPRGRASIRTWQEIAGVSAILTGGAICLIMSSAVILYPLVPMAACNGGGPQLAAPTCLVSSQISRRSGSATSARTCAVRHRVRTRPPASGRHRNC